MAPLAIYNKVFLNNLFTTKEFEFINHIEADTQNLNDLIKDEENLRDVLVIVINKLQELVLKEEDGEKNKVIEQKLVEVKNKFELINNNIQTLQECKMKFENINNLIIELLIKIESENKDESSYESEISTLKEIINKFSIEFEETKIRITSNQTIVNEFLDKEEINNYLNYMEIDLNKNIKKEKVKEQIDKEEMDDTLKKDLNNSILKISEKDKKVYLPYSVKELSEYLRKYPDQYSSLEDVIEKEFILPSDFYLKHPVVARFRETYSLIRDKEAKSVLDAIKFSIDLMFEYELNPAIIAACKTQEQLENYLSCLERNKLDEFSDFEIRFELTPLNL